MSLGYFGAEEAPEVNAAAPGWVGLPLRSLDFDSNSGEFRLGVPALDALKSLGSSLTQLALSGGVVVDATPTGVSALCVVLLLLVFSAVVYQHACTHTHKLCCSLFKQSS